MRLDALLKDESMERDVNMNIIRFLDEINVSDNFVIFLMN